MQKNFATIFYRSVKQLKGPVQTLQPGP